jgi:hypothetical protein
MEVVLKLGFTKGAQGQQKSAEVTVRDPAGAITAVPADLRWTFADHEANDAQPRDRDVDVAVATLYAGRAQDEALDRNREGDRDGARRVLRATAQRIRSYAGTDARLLGIAERLELEAEDYGERALSAMELKQAAFTNYVADKVRSPLGLSRRIGHPR